jgi:hypothetical protein
MSFFIPVPGFPVRAFISIEKAIKPAVELRTEFHLAGRDLYAMDMNALTGKPRSSFIVHHSSLRTFIVKEDALPVKNGPQCHIARPGQGRNVGRKRHAAE